MALKAVQQTMKNFDMSYNIPTALYITGNMLRMLYPRSHNYLVGGALLPHSIYSGARDYDIVVMQHDQDSEALKEAWSKTNKSTVYTSYETQDDSVEAIVKFVTDDIKVDILFAQRDWNDIESYMKRFFPLDVQETALDLFTGKIYNPIHSVERIVDKTGTISRALKKYMKYYPSAEIGFEVELELEADIISEEEAQIEDMFKL